MIEVFKFWEGHRYEENKEQQDPNIGDAQGPQGNIQGISKQLSLVMPRKASPLSSPTLSVTSPGAMFSFVTCYVFYLERQFILFGFDLCYL